MYSGFLDGEGLDGPDGDLLELLVLADKYLVLALVEALSRRLREALQRALQATGSALKACDLLRAAAALGSAALLAAGADFVRRNRWVPRTLQDSDETT